MGEWTPILETSLMRLHQEESTNETTDRLQALIADWERQPATGDPDRLRDRIEAMDQFDTLLVYGSDAASIGPELKHRASTIYSQLEAANHQLYRNVRSDIQHGRGAEQLLRWIPPATATASAGPQGEGYDYLDEIVSGILQFEEPQVPGVELASEMVFYQPTPARHIFDLIRRGNLSEDDELVDLGSGLGHVPLLAAICTRAQAIGVELEPAYVHCARQAAGALNLGNVRFHSKDVRAADFSTGSLFYLYTPFSGTILRDVLDRLRGEAARREIRIGSFGPCTRTLALEPWLTTDTVPETDRITLFRSR